MKILILILGIILTSCNNKKSIEPEISFKIHNKELYKNNFLKIEIINKSHNDYFICLDTTSIYFNLGIDYETNEFFHPKPIFYFNQEIIEIAYPSTRMIKPMYRDTTYINCIKRNVKNRQKVWDDLRELKKTLLLKKNTSIVLKLPFNNSYTRCNKRYTYITEKGNFEIQFKYRMNREYFNKIIDKKFLLKYQDKNFKPYFGEIVSNKVPYILK